MFNMLRQWYGRHFSDPQVVILALLLLTVFSIVVLLNELLAPVFAAVVIAYILEGLISRMHKRWHMPRWVAVLLVMLTFLVALVFLFLSILPVLVQQLGQFFRELPTMLLIGQERILLLPERYPNLFSVQEINAFMSDIRVQLANLGQRIVSVSLASLVDIFTFIVYLVTVPILVFFILIDKQRVLQWFRQFLPDSNGLTLKVWHEVDRKIGSYVRGKFIEILIVGAAAFVVFRFLGLNYALLLSVVVGLSVIIPYVGAIAVTIPVVLVAYFQWGLTGDFWTVVSAYVIIQLLDGNVLVPLLFSEVVNLHPIAIVVAILFFGGIWGVWGIFFSIPLATLIDTVIKAWPRFVSADAETNIVVESTINQSVSTDTIKTATNA